jgi:hypothetical protein
MTHSNKLQKDNHWLHLQVMDRSANRIDFLVRQAEWKGDELLIELFEDMVGGSTVPHSYPKDFFPIVTHAFIPDGSDKLPELLANGAVQDFSRAPLSAIASRCACQ